MPVPLPPEVRALLDAPNYVHLATLRADGSPRNWVVWASLEGDYILICTGEATWKARDMRRDPRVALSVVDLANPYRMAAVQARVVEVRPDQDCRYMDPISVKYTSAPSPVVARVVCALSSKPKGQASARSASPTSLDDRPLRTH